MPADDLPADDLRALVTAARALVPGDGTAVLGITGPPGAGKSTLASCLVDALVTTGGLAPDQVAPVPMDGFHLADASLDRLGLRERKGAPETFDVHGYVAALHRIRAHRDAPVYVPGFERELEQPIAAALVVAPTVRLVVTEGNYLLHDRDGWEQVRPLLDAVWYVDAADALRRERLVARHVRFGKAPRAAADWVDRVDEPNAVLVAATRARADRLVTAPNPDSSAKASHL